MRRHASRRERMCEEGDMGATRAFKDGQGHRQPVFVHDDVVWSP